MGGDLTRSPRCPKCPAENRGVLVIVRERNRGTTEAERFAGRTVRGEEAGIDYDYDYDNDNGARIRKEKGRPFRRPFRCLQCARRGSNSRPTGSKSQTEIVAVSCPRPGEFL